jgi:hypothetical protein
MATLKSMVSDVDDLVGRELEPGGALSLAMDYSDLLLRHPGAVDEAGFTIANHLMDLAALGLGARSDVAASARRGGVRAVRLKAVLMILEKRFTEPDFSAQKLAAAAGLSERYVNELLLKPAPASPCGCWNCGCTRRRSCSRARASGASATSPSDAASTTCPTSTVASAAASD